MAQVVAADVVVPLEVAVVLAHVPVLRGDDAVAQAAVVQHRQVEATAVPADQLRHMALDRVEEALDQLAFRALALGFAVDQRMDADAVGIAEHEADDENALQVQRHEVALARLLALRQLARIDRRIVGVAAALSQSPQPSDVGN